MLMTWLIKNIPEPQDIEIKIKGVRKGIRILNFSCPHKTNSLCILRLRPKLCYMIDRCQLVSRKKFAQPGT